jgi:hypothetical protein
MRGLFINGCRGNKHYNETVETIESRSLRPEFMGPYDVATWSWLRERTAQYYEIEVVENVKNAVFWRGVMS